jgi:hypothetical protein
MPGLKGALLGVWLLASGCGHHPAPPPAAKPAAKPASAATNGTPANAVNEYASVFEDLPAQEGKDPFYPTSHRRYPAAAASTPDNPAPSAEGSLILKGILHAGRNSQAVINTRIFEVGDDLSVTVPSGKVQVRCLEIGSDFVRVQVEGQADPETLRMQQKK